MFTLFLPCFDTAGWVTVIVLWPEKNPQQQYLEVFLWGFDMT